jgi:hypothetical protein
MVVKIWDTNNATMSLYFYPKILDCVEMLNMTLKMRRMLQLCKLPIATAVGPHLEIYYLF